MGLMNCKVHREQAQRRPLRSVPKKAETRKGQAQLEDE